jgi:Ca2+-binding RTX toxin-like protein
MPNYTGTNGPDTINGSNSDDYISGLQGDDLIFGNAGNDEIVGWQGADIIYGGIGNDTLSGGSGNDSIYGEGGNDILNAYSGLQLLDGGSGDDTFNTGTIPLLPSATLVTMVGGLGTDSFFLRQIGSPVSLDVRGGSGIDTIIFETSASYNLVTSDIEIAQGNKFAVSAGAFNGVQSITTASGTEVEIELISAGASDLRMAANTNLRLLGFSGANNVNIITASSVFALLLDGADRIISGSGSDYIELGAGADTLASGAGDDVIFGDAGSNLIDAGNGNDLIQSGNHILGTPSGEFNDTINAGNGDDIIHFIHSGSYQIQRASVAGGDGYDTLRLEGRIDISYSSIEFSEFDYVEVNAGFFNSIASIDESTIGGSRATINLLTAGSSILRPTSTMRADVNGTSGNDSVSVIAGNASWVFVMEEGADSVIGTGGSDFIYGGQGNDSLLGMAGNDSLQADYGADLLDGGAGNDTLVGSIADGNSTLRGGSGADTLQGNGDKPFNEGAYDVVSYEGSDAAVTINLATSYANGGHATGDVFSFVYGVIGSDFGDSLTGDDLPSELSGGAGADTISGQGGSDQILGGSGSDILNGDGSGDSISGGAGNDTLDGGTGTDSMIGGADNDTYVVDDAGDVTTEALNAGTDLVRSSVNHTLRSNVENLTLTGTGNTTGIGNSLANILVGNSGNNILDGGTGADAMRGGAGNDRYTFDNAGDTASELAGEGLDTVVASVAHTLRGNFENLTIIGAATNAFGSSVANILTGNGLNNILNGKEGSDVMTGGAGLDTFMFDTALGPTNVDRITDFNPVDDAIRLEDAIFSALPVGTLAATAFHAGTAAADAADRIIYDQAMGRIFYDADGLGGAAQVLFAQLDSKPTTLSHLDFFVT